MAKSKIHGEGPGGTGNPSCASCEGNENDSEKGAGRESATGTLGGGDEGGGNEGIVGGKGKRCEEFVSELQGTAVCLLLCKIVDFCKVYWSPRFVTLQNRRFLQSILVTAVCYLAKS